MALKYEPTISLGNILAALAMLASGAAAWTSTQREVERTQGQVAIVQEKTTRQDLELRDVRADMQNQMRELRLDVKELSQKVGMALAQQGAAAPVRR